jgi:hypothetical protein
MAKNSTAEKIDEKEPIAQEPEKVEVPDSIKPVGINRFGLAAEKRNHYLVNCKRGTDPAQALETEFYEHIARSLGRGDIVTVEPDDMAWELSVKVIDRGHNWALVKKREFFDYGGAAVIKSEMPQKYKVEWAGTTEKFRVLFNGDVLKSGFATEALASQYASNHAQALKR